MNATLRRVEQRNSKGEVIGVLQTSLSDEELAERDRQQAARREALLSHNMSVTVAARAAETAEREALAGENIDRDARERLRDAHTILAEARDDLHHRRVVAAAATRHFEHCQAAYETAKQQVAESARRARAALVRQLEEGAEARASAPDQESEAAAAAAWAALAPAVAAHNELTAQVGTAEHVVEGAKARVKEAARGVIKLHVSELRSEIDGLNAQLAERRDRLNRLMPTLAERRWPVPWPAEAEALLTDPEGAL